MVAGFIYRGRNALLFFFAFFMFACGLVDYSAAQQSTAMPPAKVQQLIDLLNEPEVQAWLQSKQSGSAAGTGTVSTDDTGQMPMLTSRLARIKAHFALLATSLMAYPGELTQAGRHLVDEVRAYGVVRTAGEISLVPLLALFGTWISALIINGRKNFDAAQAQVDGRTRSLLDLAPAFVSAIACFIPFLIFEWPPIIQQAAILSAAVFIVIRVVLAFGRGLVTLVEVNPETSMPETVPDDASMGQDDALAVSARAHFWFRRGILFISYFAIGWAYIELMRPLGFSGGVRLLTAYGLGIGLVLIALEAIWSRPSGAQAEPYRRSKSWLLTVYCILLWCIWVIGLPGLLWLGIYALLLPPVLSGASVVVRAIRSLLVARHGRENSLSVVLLERGIRAVIIAVAALWLARMFGMELSDMATGQTTAGRITKGILGGVVILLVADLLWQLVCAYIGDRLATSAVSTAQTDEERARASRVRTLLPIFRNILAVSIAIIAVLMILSGLGIEIGPLIAGAGVAGVAIGFGAQTIVKDVISGMFYLWDDAFRVGEYIETGNYKGTVESFSLRSVKLRHHRGPLTTVPFGSLGAIQNASRDWTVDKFTIRVSYDTDLNKLRKLIKQVGEELMANPDYRPHIIQPLKMKGVVQFGEYAIEVRVGMTTKPGEQFMIRRDAMFMIKKVFKENGIEFGVPTVQVSRPDQGDAAAAAAQLNRAAQQAASAGNMT